MMKISVTGAKDLSLALQTVAEPIPPSSSPNFAGERRPNPDKPGTTPAFRAASLGKPKIFAKTLFADRRAPR
jgi:hypothetical protein